MVEKIVESFKPQKDKKGGDGSKQIHAGATSKTYGCHHPYTCRRGESRHRLATNDDGPSTYKAYAGNHLCCNARDIKTQTLVKAIPHNSIEAVG